MKLRLIVCLLGLLYLAPAFAAVTETCVVCGEPLPDSVYLVPDQVAGDKKKICGSCVTLTQICYLCGLPVKRELTELSDGRILCARDAKSVVLDEDEARRICTETKNALDRHFARFTSFPETNITITIADRVSLLAFFKMPGNDYECPNVMGYIQTRTNRARLHHEISVMSGLLPGVLRATYAHECTHAWLAENLSEPRQDRLARDTQEGFCELVAYLTMGALGDSKTQDMITKNAYTRGQVGLLIEAESRFGFNEVVDWMKAGEDNRLMVGQVDRIRRTVSPPVAATSKAVASKPTPVPPAPTAVTQLVLQGITWAGGRSLASINNRNLARGEEAALALGGTNVTIRCVEIRPDAVVIEFTGSGTKQELKLTPARP
jgi:hypothetical protein